MPKERPKQLSFEIGIRLHEELNEIFPQRGLKTAALRMLLTLFVRAVKSGEITIVDLLAGSLNAKRLWDQNADIK